MRILLGVVIMFPEAHALVVIVPLQRERGQKPSQIESLGVGHGEEDIMR